jgi:hypothetical protein
MPSLRFGTAEVYSEVFDTGEALGTSTFTIVALGTLSDGSRFQFSVREEGKPESNFNHIRIQFR